MIWLYVILLAIVVSSLRWPQRGKFVENFAGKETANIIKGIFIWLVFISHLSQYVQSVHPEILKNGVSFIQSFLGQMVVVPFCFIPDMGC